MKTPAFTDTHRWPNGPYVRSESTDVRQTIARERERLKSMSKVIPITRKEKAS
jgi:hypothetical protein